MTDSSILLPNTQAVTSDCLYNLKPSAVRSRSYRASIPPTNKSSFVPGDTMIFYVPGGRRNTYLDTAQSYIRYTIKNNDTSYSATFDGSGACVLNRLDAFHGSNLLETIQQYNAVYNYILDVQTNAASRIGMSAAYGFNTNLTGGLYITESQSSSTTATTIIITAANSAIQPGQIVVGTNIPPNTTVISVSGTTITTSGGMTVATLTQDVEFYSSGSPLSVVRAGSTLAASGGSQTICMPVMSGVIGMYSEKALPIGLLVDDIRLEFSLEQNLIGMVWSGTPTNNWTITNAELELCIIELSDEGEQMVRSITPPERPIYIHSSSWRHYVSSLAASTSGMYSTLVPARFASVKQLVLCPRRSTEINSATSYSLSSRINPNIQTYWWRCGSSIIPNKYITLDNGGSTTAGFAEGFTELLRSWHALNSYYISTSLPYNVYNVADGGAATFANGNIQSISTFSNSFLNGFVIAQELESFAQKNDVMIAGLNTLSSQVFFECNIASTGPTVSYTLDFYAWYDQILVLENGILSVRF